MTKINLLDNRLNGSIPPEVGNFTKLQYLYLFRNQLSGSIPSQLGNLTNLQDLYLYENHWQPIPTQADTANNTFTSEISQLGTFALGYDITPPVIEFVSPVEGDLLDGVTPLLALISDSGAGINGTTVNMELDGQKITAMFNSYTGELSYMPMNGLSNGQHTLVVTAVDMVGNFNSNTMTFQVNPSTTTIGRIYLPLIIKAAFTFPEPTPTLQPRKSIK